jgi:hypothetical protein
MSDAEMVQVKIEQKDQRELSRQSKMVFGVLRKGLREVNVSTARGAPSAGGKGDPITLATIVLTAFTSGAVVALVNCFKAVFARDHTIKLSLNFANGKKITIDSKNVGTPEIRQLLIEASKAVPDPSAIVNDDATTGTRPGGVGAPRETVGKARRPK